MPAPEARGAARTLVAADLAGEAGDPGEGPGSDAGRPLLGSLAATLGIQAVQAVTGVLLARILGPAGRGELTAVILWPTLMATLGNLGMYQALTYYAARTRSLGVLVGSTLVFLVADAALLVGAGLLLLPVVLGGQDPEVVATGQRFLALYIPFTLLTMTMLSILNGIHRFRWFQSLRVLLVFLTLGTLVLLELTGGLTLERAVIGYLAGSGAVAAIGLVVVIRGAGQALRPRAWALREMLGYGLKTQLSLSMWNMNERADQLVLSAFFSAASLGLYVVAVTMTSLTTLIGFSFALVALPLTARAVSRGAREEIAHAVVGATLVVASAITICLLIVEPWLIRVLFGEEFAGAVDVGRVLLVAAVFFGLNRVLEAILQGVGRPLESSIGEAIALGCTAVGLAVLLPTTGILGAGITSLLAYLAASVFLLRRVARALEVPAVSLLKPDVGALRKMLRMSFGGNGSGGNGARTPLP